MHTHDDFLCVTLFRLYSFYTYLYFLFDRSLTEHERLMTVFLDFCGDDEEFWSFSAGDSFLEACTVHAT